MTAVEIHGLLARGELDAARSAVRAAYAGGAPADPEWAEVCAAAGLSELAIQTWRAVLAQQPDDVGALTALAELHELRGDDERAAACRAKLALPAPAPVAEEPHGGPPTAGDLVRFASRFGGRAGVHARMWARGDEIGYSPVEGSLTPELVEAHLRGDQTLGSYLVRHDDRVGQVVFDLDLTREAIDRAAGDPERVRLLGARLHVAGLRLRAVLADAGIPGLFVDSGYKGRHYWVFLDPPAPAAAARAWARGWAAGMGALPSEFRLEVFPKQDQVAEGGLGNLVKLPLGRHLRTGRRCVLLDAQGGPTEDPWAALREVRAVDLGMLPRAPASVEEGAAAEDPDLLPAVPLDGAPRFTDGDFEAWPRLAALLGGCGVVREIVRASLAELRIERDERVVLEQVLGHWPEGVAAANFVLERVGADGRMGRVLQSTPISCNGVRRRVPDVAERVGCACPFDAPETYPHPHLHARGVGPDRPERAPDLDDVLLRLGRLEARARAIDAELGQLRAVAARGLAAAPGGQHLTEDGRWWLQDVEGLPVVRFAAAGGG